MTGFTLLPAFHHRLHLAHRPGTDTLSGACGCPPWTKVPDADEPVEHCRCCGSCWPTKAAA